MCRLSIQFKRKQCTSKIFEPCLEPLLTQSSECLFFFHSSPLPDSRATTRVFIGSLYVALRKISFAFAIFSAVISQIIRPRLTTATQNSGAPLPLPIRVSAGFFETGLSGNTRRKNFASFG